MVMTSRRTAEDKKAASYLRAGENLREAYSAIENAYMRVKRIYPNREHDCTVKLQQAHDQVREVLAALDVDYADTFREQPGTLKKMLRDRSTWPQGALGEEDDDE